MPKPTLINRVANAYVAFAGQTQQDKAVNSTRGTSEDFLRYGNRGKNTLQLETSGVEITDQDMYTGDTYAVINKRANRASALGKKFLFTDAAPAVMNAAQKSGKEIEHPYLKLIRTSKEFSRRKFWHDISTYLDLEGVYYLMAVRAIRTKPNGEIVVGAVQKFQMLNPYQVHRVVRQSDGEIGGYIESKNGLYREIPKEMIIEIRLLNPFDNDQAFSMTDAAKETVFTIKQANDYTRHSIKGNINAPGAISTGVELDDQVFDNFVSRIQNHAKGEPLYGNGTGAINWSSMQIDLDKAGLDKINDISRSTLFSVAGVSDMLMGRQKAGTGREVSKTQKDEFTENAIMPQVEDILDALNLDYRKYYPEWEQDEYEIILDNPLEADREAELKDIEIREKELNLREGLISLGYEYELANKYAHGDITLEELGEPTLEPELSDEEADAIAARQLGEEPNAQDESADEPEAGDEVKELDQAEAANRVLTTNRFVDPKENKKKVKAALKRRKSAPKSAEDKEEAKEAEEDSKKIISDDDKKKKVTKEDKKTKTRVIVELDNELEDKTINQLSIRDNFPDLYEGLEIDTRAVTDDKYRGCIMINTEKIPVTQFVKNADADLFEQTDYDQGAVPAETVPHATLLYGLLNNGNIWKDKVDTVLSGWEMPTVKIKEVSFFDLGDSKAVIGLLEETSELLDANQRLSLLPHLNTFSEYHPHVTLAYITQEADVDKWVKTLGKKYNGQVIATKGINYGDAPQEDANNHVEDEHDTDLDVKKKTNQVAYFLAEDEIPSNAAHSHSNSLAVEKEHNHAFAHNATLEKAQNALDPSMKDSVILQEANLENAVRGLEADVVNAVIEALRNGNLGEAKEIISEAQEQSVTGELALVLAGFFTVLFPIYASQLLISRLNMFNRQGFFAMTEEVVRYINKSANEAAESHVSTVLKDIAEVLDKITDKVMNETLIRIVQDKVNAREEAYTSLLPNNPNLEDITTAANKGKFDDTEAYKLARDQIRQGEGLEQVVKAVQQAYTHISATRAKTIARHESSRVFNMSQYQADLQFLVETNNMDRAFKRLRSRVDNPCAVCSMLIAKSHANPIPFNKNFADLGDELTATYRKDNGKMAVQKLPINYEAITAGNVHVNCNCEYELVIKNDDGSYNNSFDFRVVNGKGDEYNPYRAKDGKFASGPSGRGSSDKEDKDDDGIDAETGMGKVSFGGDAKKERERLKKQAEKHDTLKSFVLEELDKRWYGDNIVTDIKIKEDWSDPSSLKNEADELEDGIYEGGDGYLYEIKDGKANIMPEYRAKFNWDSGEFTVYKKPIAPKDVRTVPIYHNTNAEGLKATDLNTDRNEANFPGIGNDLVGVYFRTNGSDQTFGENTIEAKLSKDANYVDQEELEKDWQDANTDQTLTEFALEKDYDVVVKYDDAGEAWEVIVINTDVVENPENDLLDIYDEVHNTNNGRDSETGMGYVSLADDDDEEEVDEDIVDFGRDQDGYEVKDYILEEYDSVKFSEQEQASVHEYTGGRYQSINHLLRHGDTHEDDESPEKTIEFADVLLNAIGKTELKEDTVLYRGSGFDTELAVGDVIKDRAFSSTSLQSEVAEEFTGSEENEEKEFKYVMKIKAPKGTKGLFPATAGVAGEENEFILPPNTGFKVVKIAEPNEDDYEEFYTMEVELV